MKLKLFLVIILTNLFLSNSFSQPNLEWAKAMGGAHQYGDASNFITTDDLGYVYVTGSFVGTADFDPGVDSLKLTSNGLKDIFLQKLDANGNLIWAKSFGGSLDDEGICIAIDNLGYVNLTGYFMDTVDFDPGAGFSNQIAQGFSDYFVQKIDSSGNLVWIKTMGSITGDDKGNSIISDSNGNLFIVGNFTGSVDFDPGLGISNLTSNGDNDVFIQKLDPNGDLVWAQSIGGTDEEHGNSLTLDSLNNIYVTGIFNGVVDFDSGTGITNLTSNGGYDVFIQKVDSNGSLIWVNSFGGTNSDLANSITLDASGNVYTTGSFQGTVDFDPSASVFNITASGGYNDVFVHKLDNNGNFIWATNPILADVNHSRSIATDVLGNVYIIGTATGPLSATFMQKLDASGNQIWNTTFVSSPGDHRGKSLTISSSGDLFITGFFQQLCDFNPGAGTYNLAAPNDYGIYVVKFSSTVGIKNFEIESKLTIYPNPASNKLFIDTKLELNETIIIDIAGKVIVTTKQSTKLVNVTNLSDGIYFIKLITDKGVITKKFVKQ